MRDHLGDLGRIAVSGVMIALFLGAIGLMISSFTGRKSIAVAIIVLGFLIAEALAGALTFALSDSESRFARYVLFLSPSRTISGLAGRLFHKTTLGIDVPLWLILAEMAAVIVVACTVMYLRYVPNE
jgi:hypothetical protein